MLIAQISDMHIKPPGELLVRPHRHRGFPRAGGGARQCARSAARHRARHRRSGRWRQARGIRPPRRLLAPLAMPVHLIPGNHDARDAMRAVFADHAYLPRDRLPAVRDRGPAGAPDRARYAGAGQGPRRAVRRAARLAGGAAGRKRPADGPVHASSAVRLRHRRLRRPRAEAGRAAARRAGAPPRQCRARDVRPRPSADPGALGRHHGLDRAQHGASGDARPARRRAALA